MEQLSLQHAEHMIDAAIRAAADIPSPSSIAIVDAGRNLLAFRRMDKAPLGSIEIAIAKAYTARSFNMATADLDPIVQPGQPLYGIGVTHHHPLVTFGGGIPVHMDGIIVGAVGVSGGTVVQDMAVAQAAVNVLTNQKE